MQAKGNCSGCEAPVQRGLGLARFLGQALIGAALLAPATMFVPAPAAAASLGGDWSGEGTVTKTDGPTEKVRCRVRYKQESAKVYGVEANCASTSKKMTQKGEVLEVRPGVYKGEFNLTQYDLSGDVRVEMNDDGEEQKVTFKSAKGGGEVFLKRR